MNLFSKLLIMLPSCTLIWGCESNAANDEKSESAFLNANKTTTTVGIVISEYKRFESVVLTNGKIKSAKEQLVNSESDGRIIVCNARPGKKVSEGTVIIQLDTTLARYRFERAKLDQFNNEKEYESQLLGYANLLDANNKSADTIRQMIKISSGLAGTEQDIKEVNYEISKASIKAPFTGILADVKVLAGQRVKSGEELFTIYDPNDLVLEAKVLEADIGRLNLGSPAIVSPISNSNLLFKSTLHEINPYVDENGMVLILLKIENPHRKAGEYLFFPGMNCTAVIKIPSIKAVVVPKGAIVMRGGKAVVFTAESGKAKWNYVVAGRDNGTEVEIVSGIKPGQKVIASDNIQLTHDAPISEVVKTNK